VGKAETSSVKYSRFAHVSAADIDTSVLNHFQDLADEACLTIVLGAGASVPSGLPDWDSFASTLAILSELVPNHKSARKLLEKQDHMFILEAARSLAGKNWPQYLNEALYGNKSHSIGPSALHLAVANHYAKRSDQTVLATLNYDVLLEHALHEAGITPTVSIGASHSTGNALVHHLHGAIFDGLALDPIATFRDYAELVADPEPWQKTFLEQALKSGPLLLAGTSYRDPDIRHWLHVILRDRRPKFPAIVTIAREGLGFKQDEFFELNEALKNEWEAIGLSVLVLEDLTDIAQTIRELQHLGTVDYQSPHDRVKHVWQRHLRQFEKLQVDYSAALAANCKSIGTQTDFKAHRGTLWLAHGNQQLTRWASDAWLYTNVRELKSVPTGHDSAWIASESLSSEEVKIKKVDRDQRVNPKWDSVLAIPIRVNSGDTASFTPAVVTFGISKNTDQILGDEATWRSVIGELEAEWSDRLTLSTYGR